MHLIANDADAAAGIDVHAVALDLPPGQLDIKAVIVDDQITEGDIVAQIDPDTDVGIVGELDVFDHNALAVFAPEAESQRPVSVKNGRPTNPSYGDRGVAVRTPLEMSAM